MKYVHLWSYKIFSCETSEMLVNLAENVEGSYWNIPALSEREKGRIFLVSSMNLGCKLSYCGSIHYITHWY